MAFQGAAGTVAGGGWGAGGSTHRAGPPSTGLTQDTGTRWAVPGAGCVCGLRLGEANRLQAPTQSLWGSPNRKELPPCSAAQPGRPPDTPESQGAEQGKPPSCQKRTFHPWPQSTRPRETAWERRAGSNLRYGCADSPQALSKHTVWKGSQESDSQDSRPQEAPRGPEMPPSEDQCCERADVGLLAPREPGHLLPGAVERSSGQGRETTPFLRYLRMTKQRRICGPSLHTPSAEHQWGALF